MKTFDIELTPGSVKQAMIGVQSGDLWMVPRDRIRVLPGFNVRDKDDEYRAAVREYADSMKANGYQRSKPMAGYVASEGGESHIILTDGHTRLDSFDLAVSEGWEGERIPLVTSKGQTMTDLTVALVTANSGRQLRPQELAQVCKRLVGYNLDESEIARRIGKTKGYVENLLLLAAAPAKVRGMVSKGQVSASLAIESVKRHGDKATEKLEAGLAKAEASGKTKVTKKAMPKPAKRDLLAEGVAWIGKNVPRDEHLDASEKCTRLLAFLTGEDPCKVLDLAYLPAIESAA